jgi:hypothetical protein
VSLTQEQERVIDRKLEDQIYRAFEAIHGLVEGYEDAKPSDIARYLDTYWDLGDYYREWWESDDEGEWT